VKNEVHRSDTIFIDIPFRSCTVRFLMLFVRALAKVPKETIISVIFVCLFLPVSAYLSVRPSVRLSVRMGQLGSHWTDFHEI